METTNIILTFLLLFLSGIIFYQSYQSMGKKKLYKELVNASLENGKLTYEYELTKYCIENRINTIDFDELNRRYNESIKLSQQ